MASLDTPQISAILVQDSEGERIVAKFWSPSDFPDAGAEAEFERKLFKKTKASGGPRADAEVLMLEGFTVVFKGGPDVTFTVVGPQEENDLMLVAVLDSRMATARYGGYLRASMPPFWTTTDSGVVREALARWHAPPDA